MAGASGFSDGQQRNYLIDPTPRRADSGFNGTGLQMHCRCQVSDIQTRVAIMNTTHVLPLSQLNLPELADEPADEPSDRIAVVKRGRLHWMFKQIAPYAGAAAAILMLGALLATMYLTWLSLEWATFLSGILVAAVLSVASRSARAEWLITRRTAQLSRVGERLAREMRLRQRAEQAASRVGTSARYLDEVMPVMQAHIDGSQRIDHHNRAFRLWLGLPASSIDGQLLHQLPGLFSEDATGHAVREAFAGRLVHRERLYTSPGGQKFRLLEQYLPEFGETGEATGVCVLLTDVTSRRDATTPTVIPVVAPLARPATPRPAVAVERDEASAQLLQLLTQNQFTLYSQSIKALTRQSGALPFREILLRLKDEEEGLTPPGTFLPMAEQYGMLPQIDQWVFHHLAEWVSREPARQDATYSINVSRASLIDAEFGEFVHRELLAFALPGRIFCFELQQADVVSHATESARCVATLKQAGCRIAIAGFDGMQIPHRQLEALEVDFVKIDAGLIINILRHPADLARVKAIHAVVRAIGIRTIAECVEDDATIVKLHALGIDYAQGFGIARPRPLGETPQAAPDPHLAHAA